MSPSVPEFWVPFVPGFFRLERDGVWIKLNMKWSPRFVWVGAFATSFPNRFLDHRKGGNPIPSDALVKGVLQRRKRTHVLVLVDENVSDPRPLAR